MTALEGAPKNCSSILGEDKSRQDPPGKKPIAYERGIQDFYGRDFIVTPNVLIPRPETEQIIDTVLSLAGKPFLPGVKPSKRILPSNPIILDVGTGSGCIAITLKKELPEADVYASDISKKAIKIAQKNAKNHSATIHFIISHLLNNVKFTPDVIVANLPYVDKDWSWLDKSALNHEPDIALYANNRGYALIYKLIEEASKQKVKHLILEADPCQHNDIVTHAKKNKYRLNKTQGYVLYFIDG